ncbi:hypothetical protein [Marinobacterium weihaiense]|uniref:Uncharacterized protein n=1 Tax=Marinobacterium weihaiense TaxID=2851016 RepID=A0ABS6MB78_9GAMM|nr:hypothetical protein [Marinobacterium weihaiense]MBV0933530.1 hypothetical protein [Marinobacterium weihaiense]
MKFMQHHGRTPLVMDEQAMSHTRDAHGGGSSQAAHEAMEQVEAAAADGE